MPLDILELVFEFVRGEDYGKSFYRGTPQQCYLMPRSLSWVALSHVCHYWRESAIGMKRLWRFIQISDSTRPNFQRGATTFLERSQPLHVTIHHETINVHSDWRLINDFYARLAENPYRIAGFFLWGPFHQTAWRLLKEGLPNAVEIGLYSGDTSTEIQIYSNHLPLPIKVGNWLEGPAFNVKKLSLFECYCRSESYPNITHLSLHYRIFYPHPGNWTFRFISSLSNTLEFLSLHNSGVDEFPPESGKEIHLPRLRQIVVMPDEDGYSLDGCLDFLRYYRGWGDSKFGNFHRSRRQLGTWGSQIFRVYFFRST